MLVHQYLHLHTNIDDIITDNHLIPIARLAMQTSYFHLTLLVMDGWFIIKNQNI